MKKSNREIQGGNVGTGKSVIKIAKLHDDGNLIYED